MILRWWINRRAHEDEIARDAGGDLLVTRVQLVPLGIPLPHVPFLPWTQHRKVEQVQVILEGE